jgi:Protein of unknown function (DUF3303)
MLYMAVKNFRNADAVPVYRRFRDSGRLAPAGLLYVSSWVSDNLDRRYQLMETEDRALLDQWTANWSDLVDFEVIPVISSKEARENRLYWLVKRRRGWVHLGVRLRAHDPTFAERKRSMNRAIGVSDKEVGLRTRIIRASGSVPALWTSMR